MNNSKSEILVKNTFIIALGQICTKFISFFLLPLYTSILTAEQFGVVDLINTLISLMVPIIFLQIDQAIFRFLIDIRGDKKNVSELISTVFIYFLFQTLLFLVLFSIVQQFVTNEYKLFLVLLLITAELSNVLLQISRGLGDNVNYSIGSLISGAGTIVLNVVLLVVYKFGAYGMLSATIVANILCSLYVFCKKHLWKFISFKFFNKSLLKKLLNYSYPLIFNQLSWWIVTVSDRLIISYYLNISANGIYSAANKISAIIITIFSIFNLTWSESASVSINDNDKDRFFSKVFMQSFQFFCTICALIIAVMPFVFDIMIKGTEYKGAYFQIPILLISTVFNIAVSLIGSIYVALKKTKDLSKTSIYAAIINIVINLLLVKKIGLFAASISTFIAYFAMALYRFVDVQKYVSLNIDYRFIAKYIVLLVGTLVFYYLSNTMICCFILSINFVFFVYINYPLLIGFINLIKKKLTVL